MEIQQLAKRIYTNNVEKGFWDKPRNVGEMLMLVVPELGEAIEAHRKERFADWQYYAEFESGLDENYPFEAAIKDTFEDELADAIIRLLDMSEGLNIDIQKHIEAKLTYNQSRPRLHGKAY